VVDAIAAGNPDRARAAMLGVISLGQARIAAKLRARKVARARSRKRG
jgi:DNA-binding FadR family transcriptional regulator